MYLYYIIVVKLSEIFHFETFIYEFFFHDIFQTAISKHYRITVPFFLFYKLLTEYILHL